MFLKLDKKKKRNKIQSLECVQVINLHKLFMVFEKSSVPTVWVLIPEWYEVLCEVVFNAASSCFQGRYNQSLQTYANSSALPSWHQPDLHYPHQTSHSSL